MAPSRPSSSWPTSATAEAPCDGSALGHMDCRMGSVVVMASLFLGRCHHSLAFLHGPCNQQGVSTDPVGTSKELPAPSLGKWSLYIAATCPSSDLLLDCGPQLHLPVPVGPASRSFFLLVPPQTYAHTFSACPVFYKLTQPRPGWLSSSWLHHSSVIVTLTLFPVHPHIYSLP